MDKYFENFWDCPKCRTKSISALRKMRCPNCGSSKTTQDFENSRMVEITDAYGLQLAKSGKNWECSYCHSVNLDIDQRCSGCHADRSEEIEGAFRVEDVTDKVKNYTIIESDSTSARDNYEPRESFTTRQSEYTASYSPRQTRQSFHHDRSYDKPKQEPRSSSTVFSRIKRPSKEQWIAIGVIALILVVAGLVYMTKCSYPGTLDSFYWERSVNVQIYKKLHDSGWSRPYDAYNVSSYSKFHHNEPIYETRMVTERESYTVTTYRTETRYVSNGNGSTRAVSRQVPSYETRYRTVTRPKQVKVRDEPIYRTYYEYNINRWVRYTTLYSNGTDKNNIYYPHFTPQLGDKDNLGATRQGLRDQTLYVYVKWTKDDKNERDRFKVGSYRGLFVGDKLQVHYLMGVPTGIEFDLKAEQPS